MFRCLALIATVLLVPSLVIASRVHGQDSAKKEPLKLTATPQWIWLQNDSSEKVSVRYEFEVVGTVKQAILAATADNHCEVFINDKKVATADDWAQLATADVANRLKPGRNVISASGRNDGGPAGLIAALIIATADGKVTEVVSSEAWRGSEDARAASGRQRDSTIRSGRQ